MKSYRDVSVAPIATGSSFVRITFTFPQRVAEHIFVLPAQRRSREVASILELEFKRRRLLQRLGSLARKDVLFPKGYHYKKTKNRPLSNSSSSFDA